MDRERQRETVRDRERQRETERDRERQRQKQKFIKTIKKEIFKKIKILI